MRFLWVPPPASKSDANKEICSSSIAKYFNDLGYEVILNQTDCKMHIEYALNVPRLGPETDDPVEVEGISNFFATPHELVEYTGLVALSCTMEQSETAKYLNSWSFSGHTMEVGCALVIRLKGMFSSELIKALWKKLK